jgi:hypothetical protein
MITKIVLREPRYRDLMDLGVPSTWVAVPGGGGFEQESFTALEEWVNRLVVEMDVNFLELLSLKDSLALRAAVRDFFSLRRARRNRSHPQIYPKHRLRVRGRLPGPPSSRAQ